ncbi:hypothetical protein MHYP_G00183660 [Metynnis hypsauchen]
MDCLRSRYDGQVRRKTAQSKWQTVFFFLCVYGMDVVFCQARYSIPEEMPEGSFVGNIAKDLGIEISRLISGKARVVTKGGRQYVELSRDKGALVVKERIDREELCKQTTPCSFSFDLIIENPIQLHRITVEVQDINDNAPIFPKGAVNLEISENTVSGARFPLDSAVDMDVGINGIQSYALSPTDNFKLEMNSQSDGSKHVEMVLKRELDREDREELQLVLIASDGGSPRKSGTVRIHVIILDANDNAPVCKQAAYKIDVMENSPVGTVLTTVNAVDADEGINGQISYSIAQASKEARELFEINPTTGDITTLDSLDYENERSYTLNIKAKDKGGLANTCKIIIDVVDVNDNPPFIQLMSFSNTIAENSPVGTTVAVINVEDADSGQNGVVQCKINENIPFKIESSLTDYYALITDEILDRENIAEYNITILVSDQGSPALHSNKTLTVKISDVNDNAPVFGSDQFRTFITENNSPGVAVLTVKARDADWGPNAQLSYFLEDSDVMGNPVSSLMSINSDSGVLRAVRSFDYEQMKSLTFNVTARDGGSPPLSSEVMVMIIVQDQNDNAPQVLYPVQTGGSVVAEIVPRSADVGYLVTKVVAVDVDSGQNSWLSYKLQKATDRALFEVGPQNGEIRTVRQVTDKDAVKQKLTVVVEDNGQPSRSAVVNINVAVADSFPELVSEFSDFTHSKGYNDNLTFYLVLALAAVSFLFITTVVVIISVKIYRWRQSRIFYQSSLPVIPYYPPGYADTGVTGTLPHMYNYDVCMTTNSRKSDCKYSTLGGQSVLVVDPSFTETMQRAMKEKEFLENADSPEMHRRRPTMQLKWQTVFFFLCMYGMDVVFCQARYSIPEEMPEGSFVGNIAKDLGIEISRLISGKARVVTKGGRQYVELSRDKGALVVKERIDREELCKQTTPCSFSFDLIIENPIQLHRITVEVQDINDNSPKFPKSSIDLTISENTASGTRFPLDSAVDMDVGINGIQNYALSPTDNFKLDVNNRADGKKYVEMVLQRELDREERKELKLVLIAYDGGSPKKSSTVQIHVSVLDVNDNTPVCKQALYKAEVKENSPIGTVLTTVSASDADEGVNGEVSYSFAQASEDARHVFDINPETGEITLLNRLDYETENIFQIDIKAMDKGGLADTCKVVIDVVDVNDNPPSIQLMSFSNTIAENSPVGTTVAVINVEDADSGQNGVVQCKINENIPFKIESSLTDYYALITDEILDRENIAEYNINILVSDQGSPALHSNKTLTVKISDVNDNAPVFGSDQFRTFITENNSPGVAVLTVKARDADCGPNARLSYFLEDSDVMGNPVSSLVSINSDSGVLHAVRSFDYEQMKSLTFNVTARDGGSPPLSSEVMVTIIVQDQNDNAPQVLYPVQTGGSVVAEIVPRSADVGYLVTKVVAVDVDSGQNAWLSYKLQKATDRALFEVGPQNGEIRTVRQVTDKDAVKQKLTVVVEDNGQPSRSAVVNINVAVADSFPELVSEFSDFTHNKEYNDNVTFYLVLALAAVSFLFITTVVVIISVKIYRWRQSRIFYQSSLPVIPYYPPGYADTGVTGTLPHMYNYDVCMTTNSRKSDCKYSTLGGQSVLVVDPSFSETLQRAMKENHLLENAESPETHRRRSTMQLKWQTVFFFLCVYGMDVVFCQARYSIPEEMPEGSFVGNIAKDLGIEISRLISGKARVVTKGGRQYVELSRDKGALVVKERIDREELCKQTTPCSFSFDLIIENPIQLHRITVEVQDINDNAPIFPKGAVNLEISENRLSGARFPLDSAVDMDVGINGIQSYALSPTDNFKLEINSQSDGSKHVEMVLQRELDREEHDELHLVLIASDGGSPRKSGTVRIHVTVLDVNDNAPVCKQAVYKIDVMENSPVGTVLTTVNAVDADEGINGDISYSIAQASKEAREMFDIHSDTGDLTMIQMVDYEIERSYTLNINAKDKGSLSDTCKVIIDVVDVNDNPPSIQLMSFSNTIAENSPVGTTVAVINVEDADSGQNGVVQCKINENIPFKIESSLTDYYALITDDILDRENIAEYNITILVSDQGSPALHSNKTLTVKISDVNDNAPVFGSDQFRTFITENNSPGVAVLTVKARDADWGPNAQLSYFLEDSDVMGNPVSSLMSINSDSGVLHAVRSFDYEQMKSLTFNVTARDGGSPPLSSEVMVTIIVQDQNDNAPQVLYPVQTGGSVVAEIVPRSADVGYLVTKVVAVDVDSGQNAWLSYKLQKATDRALFEVGPQNGEIRTVRQVTDKDAVKQKLTVVVEDNGQPSRSAVVNINVAVADSFPEVVSEFSDFTHSKEYNDNLTFYLVLALAAVSFLFITTVVVIISVKIYRWRQSRIFYQSSLPVIPYYPPGYADTGVTGTLPHMYNYDVCMTTNSRKSDCKYSTLGGQSVLVVDHSFSETLQRAMKEKEFLENAESPEMHRQRSTMQLKWQTVFFFLCIYGMDVVFCQARYSIPEEMPEGSFVGNIAKDLGIEISRLISGKARVVTKGGRQYVELSRDKGALVVKERIDREELCKQTTPCSFSFDLIIENPIQLHRITIELMSFSNTIAENSPVGTTVAVINVEDADSGQNGVVQCKINENIPFKIESSLTDYYALITDEVLDRENIPEYNITILVSDQGSPALHSNKTLTVKISDVNDNAPVFGSDQFRTFITENNSPGVAVLTVKARDADWGPNARLSYFLEDSDVMGNPVSSLVSINSDSGVLHAVRSFDYEQMKSLNFNVTARDGGSPPLSSEVMVTIIVQDQNDNAPQVLYPVQTGGSVVAEIVPRSADVGYLVTKVVAVDVDSGQNAWLSYKLQKATDRALFEVGPQNGEIRTVRQVTDKDAVKQKLTVVVEDNGQPSRSAVVNINVAVADSFPELVSEFSDFTHSKDYNDNLTFYLVLALAAVSFLFITTVVVIISVKIYRWRQSRIFYQSSLPVIPYYPPGYADTGVTGTLPHMYNYDVCMTTNSRKSDCKYSTLGGQSVLVVDQSFSETLQRAMKEKEFLENAESPEMHRRRSTMQLKWQTVFFFLCVYGMDVVFCQARYSIPEEMPEGSFVGNIAKDLGIEISRLISGKARVVTKGGRQYVELSRDKGALVVKERIDREELCEQTTPCSFSFDLIIENPIQLHRITVEVQDINDNAPIFPKDTVNLQIIESTASGKRFPLDSAVDLDVDINGIQNYALSPTNNFKLEINNQPDGLKNVEMVLQHELDREERDQLKLVLVAYDGGSPKKSSAVQIHISVLDNNDNAPVCTKSMYKAEVMENSPVGTVVTTVSAADADEGVNGEVSYSFAQASKKARKLFGINSETGGITTIDILDYEREKSYQLNVEAKDKGGLADTCKIVIDVVDVNDNPPTIQLMSFSNTIAENSPVGTTVAVINVEDADSGQNGVVQCKINENIPFKIESSLTDYYALITDEILDRENIAEYNITILVSDQGSPALHSNKTLTVKISDVNDNAPVFGSDQFRNFITENNSPGVAVLTVKARDADWGLNARLSYFLEDSDVMGNPVSSLVSINSDSGVLHAVRSFDYEQMKSLTFNVTARDGGSPPLSSEVMVKIVVQDQNDNAPQVLYPVQTGGSVVAEIVPRSADVGYLVTKVVAVDVDSGQNAWLSYKLQKATDRALFEVGPQNGEIRTVRQVTDKDAVKQKLSVVVEDNGQPSRSAVVNINVAVADSFPEVVSEFSDFTHSKDYNDNLTFYLVLALAAVSFLFITTVVVIISVKIYRWRQSRIFYQSSLPVIPYYPPGYADTGVTGTLPHMYNYDVCMTTNSRKSDCKYSTLGGQSVLVVDQSFSETLQRAMKEKEFLENSESSEVHRRRSTMQLKWQTVFFFLCVYGMDVVFCQARYSIPEEMPEGSFVGNIAKDLGIEISRLISGKARVVTKGGRQYVELSRDKGALVVKERIDREELCKQTTPCSFSFDLIIENPIQLHRITVEVQDINDNAPVFPKDAVNLQISESTASGKRFPLDSAVDLDVGINGIQSYALSPTDNFKLEVHNQLDGKKNVEMVLQHELDREERDQLKLVLVAYDGGSPKKSSAVQIHIYVLDSNDNAPVCKQSIYKAEVKENSSVGTVVTAVSAADADEGVNGEVSYSFAQASKEARNLFGINWEKGEITTLDKLDYERETSYELNVEAKDKGGLADTCKVIIDVVDVNDNPPSIQLMSFSNTIAENSPVGTTVAVINVEDADSGQNGVVQCKINENIPFKIESSLTDYYALITDDILDRENIAEYNITILVSDQGSPALHSNKTLTVKISDVNDNSPVFGSDQFRTFITENNSPGVAVLTVKARDADWGPNARLSYFLEDSDVMGNPVSSLVSINSDSGVLHAVRSFDYEQMKSLTFNVTARDGGSPPLSSEVMVTIIVQDQNDNAPQILYPVQTGGSVVAEIVPRSADVGYLVTKVVAVDVDSGQNAWLSYKLQKATDRALFEVGPQNGEIRTVRQVTDKDAVKQKLTVVVEDNGQPSRSAVVNINVAVADSFPEVVSEFSDFTHNKEYNDNLTFYLVLALAAVSFLFITTVVVIISVKIYRWRQSRIFYQSSLPVIPYYPPGYADTGVTGTLPHMYNYDVCMTTNSRKSDCKYSTLGGQSVLVVDQSFSETMQRALKEKEFLENPESPEMHRRRSAMRLKWQTVFFFLCVYGMDVVFCQARYSIPEEMPEGSFVGNIAKDLGIEISRLISGKARVVTKGGRQYVELSRDKGALVVKERIDREELCEQTTPCSFSFDLIIENPIQLHRITVEVQDINDNAPKFPKYMVNMKVSENTASGTRFPLDSAVDLDVDINGIQNYALSPTDNFNLEVHNQADGHKNVEMVLQHELDREERDQIKLVLVAYDGGSPKKSSAVQIHISVLDSNDNAPVCKQSIYKAEVKENSPVGTVVTAVSAADADEGVNGEVSYSFAQASEKARNLFEINSETGEITILNHLDYEKEKNFQLNVKAMDKGTLADTCKVIIDVVDVNDNPPSIQLMSFSNTIAENSPVGTTVAVINVEDADSGQNGVVQCKINENIPFKIESSLTDYYALITDDILDRENIAEYNITILVSDQGSPALHSNKTLTVKISDVNDNAPVFGSDQFRTFISENNSPGVAVLTVKARDADWGPNARLSYFLEDSDVMGNPVSSLVSINSDSGVLHAVRSFDYEQMKSLNFNVTARDGGSPPLSSEVMVTIIVQDQNDNTPQVLYPVQTGGSVVAEIVPRSADVGYLVTKVVAVDVDSGQNAWLSYKLQKATDRALFEVGPQNGEIRTVRQVTDKDAVKQKLTVVVEDNGQPSRSAVVNINVAVADSFPELVSEFSDFTHSKEYNDNLTFYLVLALAAVSFLFITTVVVIISVKIYRWRQSRIFYQSSLPVIPYYPPGYADTGVTGTLPHMYNYDVCMTTNSRKSDCKYSTLGGQSVLVVDPSFSETLQRAMKEKEFFENPETPEMVGHFFVYTV